MLESFGPGGSWRSQNGNDLAYLIHFRVAQKQWLAEVHLSYDTPNSKDIHSRRIRRKLEQQFRCPVPPRGYVFRIRRFAPDLSADTEIDDLDGEIISDKDVLRLHIPMKEPLFMDIEKCLGQLLGNVSYFLLLKLLPALFAFGHQFVEILFDVLKDEVCLIDHPDDFLELDDVGMVHLS